MSLDGKGAWVEPAVENYFDVGITPSAAVAQINNGKGEYKRGICPQGWHVPTVNEWAVMLDAVDNSSDYTTQTAAEWIGTAAKHLKSASTYSVADPGNGAWKNNEYAGDDVKGYGALPSGFINSLAVPPTFGGRGESSAFWSSSVRSVTTSWTRWLRFDQYSVPHAFNNRSNGQAIRCIQN
jgi:uncharacterized protein (TIGR02145 family)